MALTDTFVKTVKHAGNPIGEKYADGGGMYLRVTATSKYWRMAYRHLGKEKTLSFGVYPTVTLANARQQRERARQLLAGDIDPSAAKKENREEAVLADKNTFRSVAMKWHVIRAKTTSPKTTIKRLAHLETHIFPKLGKRPVASIKPVEILAVLKAVVGTGAVYTAGRVREICGQIFRYAIQNSYCIYDPSASMRGAIEGAPVKHRPALTTPDEFGQFLRDLKHTEIAEPLTKMCARVGLLTWTRPGELRQARWEQINLDRAEWRIPAIKMKTGKNLQAHIVPLSAQCLATLRELWPLTNYTGRLFPSNGSATGVISENTINNLFRRMGYKDQQSHHGLRASARSLLGERGWSVEALERQLDHKEANKVVAAYARGEHIVIRRDFMRDWGLLVEQLEAETGNQGFSSVANQLEKIG